MPPIPPGLAAFFATPAGAKAYEEWKAQQQGAGVPSTNTQPVAQQPLPNIPATGVTGVATPPATLPAIPVPPAITNPFGTPTGSKGANMAGNLAASVPLAALSLYNTFSPPNTSPDQKPKFQPDDAMKFAGMGAQVGSAFGPIGSAVGAGVGLIGGGIKDVFDLKKDKEMFGVRKNRRSFSQALAGVQQNEATRDYTGYGGSGGYRHGGGVREEKEIEVEGDEVVIRKDDKGDWHIVLDTGRNTRGHDDEKEVDGEMEGGAKIVAKSGDFVFNADMKDEVVKAIKAGDNKYIEKTLIPEGEKYKEHMEKEGGPDDDSDGPEARFGKWVMESGGRVGDGGKYGGINNGMARNGGRVRSRIRAMKSRSKC